MSTSMTEAQPNDSQAKQRSKKAAIIAREQIHDIAALSNDAVFGGAWSWPIKGLLHLFSHPSLLSPIKQPIIKSTILTFTVTALLFVVGYFPTVVVLAFLNGPLAFVAAVPVILGAGSAIGISISRVVWLSNAQVDLFDEVLLQEGLGTLVARGREVRGSHTGSKIGKLLTKPLDRFSREAIIRWIISLPLNAIPVVGPAIFLLYNGARAGPSYHNRYFQLKAMAAPPPAPPPKPFETHRDKPGPSGHEGDAQPDARDAATYDPPMSSRGFNRDAWVKAHRGAYAGFGTMALALDLIPGAAVVCMFGNVVGAALWASRIEKEGTVEGMAELKMEGRKEL